MGIPSILSHVSIGVNDLDRAGRFYDVVLASVDAKRQHEVPGVAVAYGKYCPEFWVQRPLDALSAPDVYGQVAYPTRVGERVSVLDRVAPATRLDALRAPDVDGQVAYPTTVGERVSVLDRVAPATRLDALRAPDVDGQVAYPTTVGERVSVLDRTRRVRLDGGVANPGNGIHFSFIAPSREAVHAFHEAALAAGARDDGAPGSGPEYGDGYYGCFVVDLDGHKIEASTVPGT